MTKLARRLREEGGFTLIELLIVVIILGVLAAIVVFAVGAFASRGKKSACKTDYRSVQTAQEAHKADEGGYAASVGALSPDYIKEDPPTDNGYVITTGTSGTVSVTTDGGTTTDSSACDDIT